LEGEERTIMTMDRGTAVQPEIGQHIYTMDGDHLGAVKELRGAYFKVDAPMQPDYWLPVDDIMSRSGDRVTVGFDKHQLSDRKAADPDTPKQKRAGGERMGVYTPTTVPAGLTGFTAGLWDEAGPAYRREWETRYANRGTQRWEDVEPGYRYGYEMAYDSRYRGRAWPEAEPDLATGYIIWARECGFPEDESAWERVRANARESWDLERDR
jgi:hypothetical protein